MGLSKSLILYQGAYNHGMRETHLNLPCSTTKPNSILFCGLSPNFFRTIDLDAATGHKLSQLVLESNIDGMHGG